MQQKTYQKSNFVCNKYAYKDENIVDVGLNVQYTISDLKKYALNVEDPEITIRQATESAQRHVVGENVMDDLLTSGADY